MLMKVNDDRGRWIIDHRPWTMDHGICVMKDLSLIFRIGDDGPS